MKTFQDLEFKTHDLAKYGQFNQQARMTFPNGYGISVVSGEYAYSSEGHPYEVAVFDGNGLTYETPITDDVIGHCTSEDVTEIMQKIQELPNALVPIAELNKANQ